MTAQNFPTVLAETLIHEGGYVNDPRDPGGETNMGISRRTYPNENIKGMTRARAAVLYRRDFWNKVRGDDLPAGMDMVGFDGAVNSGISRGARWLQTGLGVAADGAIGAKTIAAARAAKNPVAVIQKACAARMGFLRGLRTFGTFGRGWMRRVASVEATAAAMAGLSADAALAEGRKAGDTSKGQATASAATAGGGAGTSYGVDGLPDIVTYGLLAVAVVVALILLSKSRVNKERALAYGRKAVEMLT